jgi:hypothetical protein
MLAQRREAMGLRATAVHLAQVPASPAAVAEPPPGIGPVEASAAEPAGGAREFEPAAVVTEPAAIASDAPPEVTYGSADVALERAWPAPLDPAAPAVPNRPKRGPKKRRGGISRTLGDFIQPAQSDHASADAVTPPAAADGPELPAPPFVDKKM